MNILNVQDVERELNLVAVRTRHKQVTDWVMTVARNYLFTQETEDKVKENFRIYAPPVPGKFSDLPFFAELPLWAQKAYNEGRTIHVYDTTQNANRTYWQTLRACVEWLNAIPENDPLLARLNKMSFTDVAAKATGWKQDITKNPYYYIKDRPEVLYAFPNGFKMVRLESELQFERESALMNHCVYGPTYMGRSVAGTYLYASLRDVNNGPHVTIEAELNRATGKYHVIQAKGNSNKVPRPEYRALCREFATAAKWVVGGDSSAFAP